MELRERTGQAMMDCKKALNETEGDMEKAIDLLRKKGMAVMEKRGGRENKEGKIFFKISSDGKVAVMTSLCCETDFTAKNDGFVEAAEALADAMLAAGSTPADTDAISALTAANGKTVGDMVNTLISTTGEKITVGKCSRFELSSAGLLYGYVHFNGKVGTLIQIDAENDAAASSEATQALAADLAMHITAVSPEGVRREEISADVIAREEAVAREQVKGKPENIIENIVKGKIDKWMSQIVLLEQPFVKDDQKTVTELIDEVSKTAGGKLTVNRFARLQIGG